MGCAWFMCAEGRRLPVRGSGWLGAALAIGLSALGATGEASSRDVPRRGAGPQHAAVLHVRAPAAASASEGIRLLEGAGYHVAVALAPDYYVRASRSASSLPDGMTLEGDLDPLEAPGGPAPTDGGSAEGTDAERAFGGRPDVVAPAGRRTIDGSRVLHAADGYGLYSGTHWGDTSEFMIGRVAVPILFPESDGGVDTNRYDWTPALRDSVVRSVIVGLLRWTARAASRGTSLTFVLEAHAGLATRYEPIDRPALNAELWIADTLEPLIGSKESALDLAYSFANAARARHGAHWAALVFAVQNDTDPDGAFPDGFISFAKLGGPWYVLPVNNLNSLNFRLDFYAEHEMAHMFWALDEFYDPRAWWGCDLRTGYFDTPNSNSEIPAPGYCSSNVACVMRGNYPGIVCAPTEAQIGWADRDLTGVLDFHETRSFVRPDSTRFHAVTGQPVTIRGTAADDALPNLNPYHFFSVDSISVATVDSIQYRLDGGPWSMVSAEDGAFDSGTERFAVPLGALSPGSYRMEFRAWNSNGLETPVPDSTRIDVVTPTAAGEPPGGDSPRPVGLTFRAGPVPSVGAVQFLLVAPPGSWGVARVHDASGRRIRSWGIQVPGSGRLEWAWDARAAGRASPASGLYFVTVEVGGVRIARRLVVLR